MRTCIGCRRVGPTDGLVRVVRRQDATLAVGRTAPGRGAWVCAASPSCFEMAVLRGAFSRALRGGVTPEALAVLRASLADRARIEG